MKICPENRARIIVEPLIPQKMEVFWPNAGEKLPPTKEPDPA